MSVPFDDHESSCLSSTLICHLGSLVHHERQAQVMNLNIETKAVLSVDADMDHDGGRVGGTGARWRT
ncbi:hypothetical protein BC629DRAFT_1574383 [Irpex lacteus]|nr:hypothetical protein BC629DRAFT_1574383 [Irpex lacteus]